MFLFVIVVRIGGSQGLHLGAAFSFILQVADQIVAEIARVEDAAKDMFSGFINNE